MVCSILQSIQQRKLIKNKWLLPHLDGGLFSNSVYSNASGLEVFDLQTNEWVPVPVNMGVIWCGITAISASKDNFQGGFHRVQTHNDFPRLTFLYEAHVENKLVERGKIKAIYNRKTRFSETFSMSHQDIKTEEVPEEEIFTLKVLTWRNGHAFIDSHSKMKIGTLKQLLEDKIGVSFSKSIKYRFKRWKKSNT